MAKLQVNNAGLNSGATALSKMKRLSELKKHPELESIFTIQPEIRDMIVEDMKQNGYDMAQPIVEGKIDGELYIVDGYTRYDAASLACLEEVPTKEKEFENLDAAIHYCYKRQAARRNLTQIEIYNAAVKLNIPARKIADELNVAVSTITRAKKIDREASPEDIEAIKNKKKTINQVYSKVKKNRSKESDEPNDTDETSEDSYPDPNPEESGNARQPETTEDTAGDFEESDAGGFDDDILDGAAVETENEDSAETDENDENIPSVMEIVRLLNENGETNAVSVIKNAYPYLFDENQEAGI